MDWKSISVIPGIAAFVWQVLQAVRHRLVWLWQPAFIVNQLRFNVTDGHLNMWLIFRNARAEPGYVNWVALVVEFPPTWENEKVKWKRATLILDSTEDAVLVIPSGDSVRRLRLRLRLLDDKELSGTNVHLESNILEQITIWQPAVTVRLETSGGTVNLEAAPGWGNNFHVAVEKPSLRTRVLRLLP